MCRTGGSAIGAVSKARRNLEAYLVGAWYGAADQVRVVPLKHYHAADASVGRPGQELDEYEGVDCAAPRRFAVHARAALVMSLSLVLRSSSAHAQGEQECAPHQHYFGCRCNSGQCGQQPKRPPSLHVAWTAPLVGASMCGARGRRRIAEDFSRDLTHSHPDVNNGDSGSSGSVAGVQAIRGSSQGCDVHGEELDGDKVGDLLDWP
jgi:hypothetical protein